MAILTMSDGRGLAGVSGETRRRSFLRWSSTGGLALCILAAAGNGDCLAYPSATLAFTPLTSLFRLRAVAAAAAAAAEASGCRVHADHQGSQRLQCTGSILRALVCTAGAPGGGGRRLLNLWLNLSLSERDETQQWDPGIKARGVNMLLPFS